MISDQLCVASSLMLEHIKDQKRLRNKNERTGSQVHKKEIQGAHKRLRAQFESWSNTYRVRVEIYSLVTNTSPMFQTIYDGDKFKMSVTNSLD